MKRFLSVLLSVALLMNLFAALAYASPAKRDGVLNESIRFIRAIDIMAKYTDADFENNKTVSRAEFAGALIFMFSFYRR